MDPWWYVLQSMKPILGVCFGICLSKCFIPLKIGMETGNQKLVNKGSVYLMVSISSLLSIIFIFMRVG